jgi:uncharacterized cysteine cluster protein YcgN (CxxCxxCC family)
LNDFWRTKSFEEMSHEEWESICDGCAKCCLIKFRETGTGGVRYTNVACKLLDLSTCRCKDYEHRLSKVPECIQLTPEFARQVDWLPKTCAYRLIAEGKELPWWHPLRSGDPSSTLKSGSSVFGKVISEDEVDDNDLEDMIVDWFD